MNAKELVNCLENNKFIIYGTGHIAHKFYKIIKRKNLKKNLICFAVSSGEKEKEAIDGIIINNIKRVEKDSFICIAVHESIKDEMIDNLQKLGIENYVWIYPYLYEMMLGEPIKTDVSVNLSDILQTCESDYRIAIRYVAIDNYFKKNNYGYDMYIRAQAIHSSEKTAQERLYKFCELIRSWTEKGYSKKCVVSLNESNEIIDGTHRVTLAKYYNQDKIVCNIFSGKNNLFEIHGKEAMLTKDILINNGFSLDEIDILNNINKKL